MVFSRYIDGNISSMGLNYDCILSDMTLISNKDRSVVEDEIECSLVKWCTYYSEQCV